MNNRKIAPYRPRRRGHMQTHQGSRPAAPMQPNAIFFQGNLVQSMRFGAQGHELSGYVARKLVIIDQHGNKQIATEKQFFNSGKKLGNIRMGDDEAGF